MIRYAKLYSEVITSAGKSAETTRKWKQNADRLKSEFFCFVCKSNLWFYVFALIVSVILVIVCMFNGIQAVCRDFCLSLACSIFSGIIVAFFLERNANKKWYKSQIEKYNYDLCRVYSSVQRITGYTFFSDFAVGNYALNDYAKMKGINPTEANNYSMLENEIRELFKEDFNQIPYARQFASSNIAVFKQMLDDIINRTDDLMILHHDYLTASQKELFSEMQRRADDFQTTLRNYELKIYVPDIRTFDNIIKWAQNTAIDSLLTENYMQ